MADGYKLDGTHFTVPMSGPVTVELQPHPLPGTMIRAQVFENKSPTNGAPDEPAEQGLAGFTGSLTDYLGQVTTDVYGNPLCTRYQGEDPDTHVIPNSAQPDQLRESRLLVQAVNASVMPPACWRSRTWAPTVTP